MQAVHYSSCPVCGSPSIHQVFSARDHLVSNESFDILECRECSLRFTQDAPDAASIGRYYRSEDYISHSGTSRGLISKLYHRVRRLTLRSKRKLVERMLKGGQGCILDVGAGTGHFLREMKDHGWKVTGIEPGEQARRLAEECHGIRLQDEAALFQLPPASFDAITLWHVLEHVHQLHEYLEQLKKLLAEGGVLFIAVPNHESADAKAYGSYWAAYDVPRHLYHFTPRAMETLLQRHRLKPAAMLPMWYDSFYISMLSTKYRSGNTRFFPALWTGLRSNLAAMRDRRRCSSLIYVVKK